MVTSLGNVVECELNNNLPEGSISLASLNCFWVPYYIVNLCSLSFLVVVLSNCAKTQWNSDASVSTKLLSLTLGDLALLKRINKLMLGHVYEYFLAVFVFGLHYEACLWLNDCASFCVNDWFSIFVNELFLHCGKFRWNFTFHHLLVHLHELLMGKVL